MAKKGALVASYHLAVKSVSRSAGRSATAAAAYRAGDEIKDERTGLVHDYTRKQGVEHSALILPAGAPEWAADRAALWNAAEQAEKRKDAKVAREFEVALPAELDADARRELALSFAREISDRYGVAVDVAIHAPHRHGDDRNHHAHMLATTRQLGLEGLGAKTRELDVKATASVAVEQLRERWAEMQNLALERAGSGERVDHRSYKARGIDQEPQLKQGPAVTAMERKAEQAATRKGEEYYPVTAVGQHNAGLREKRILRDFIERGTAWLKERGVDVGRVVQSASERIAEARSRLNAAMETGERAEETCTKASKNPAKETPATARLAAAQAHLKAITEKQLEKIRDRSRDIERSRDRDKDRGR